MQDARDTAAPVGARDRILPVDAIAVHLVEAVVPHPAAQTLLAVSVVAERMVRLFAMPREVNFAPFASEGRRHGDREIASLRDTACAGALWSAKSPAQRGCPIQM